MRLVNEPECTSSASDVAKCPYCLLNRRWARSTTRMYARAAASESERAGSPASLGWYAEACAAGAGEGVASCAERIQTDSKTAVKMAHGWVKLFMRTVSPENGAFAVACARMSTALPEIPPPMQRSGLFFHVTPVISLRSPSLCNAPNYYYAGTRI